MSTKILDALLFVTGASNSLITVAFVIRGEWQAASHPLIIATFAFWILDYRLRDRYGVRECARCGEGLR